MFPSLDRSKSHLLHMGPQPPSMNQSLPRRVNAQNLIYTLFSTSGYLKCNTALLSQIYQLKKAPGVDTHTSGTNSTQNSNAHVFHEFKHGLFLVENPREHSSPGGSRSGVTPGPGCVERSSAVAPRVERWRRGGGGCGQRGAAIGAGRRGLSSGVSRGRSRRGWCPLLEANVGEVRLPWWLPAIPLVF